MSKSKKSVIKSIKKIISEWGGFGSGEVEQNGNSNSPVVNFMGSLIGLAEDFNLNGITVRVYDTKSVSSDEITEYVMLYEDLPIDILEEILTLCELYEVDQLKTEKRISN